MMDHENYFKPRTLNSVQPSEAVADFKEDISEKRKAVPKQSRNPNRGFVVRDDGNPRTFKIGKKVKWSDFRLWPEEIQAKYLKDLASKYPEIAINNIAVMMGVEACSLRYLNKKLGGIITPKPRGGSTIEHDTEVSRFYNDFDCADNAIKVKEKRKGYKQKYKNNNAKKNEKVEFKPTSSIVVQSVTVSFNIDTDDIAQFLKAAGFSGQVTLTVSKNNK
jgi:hypothetical protein